MKVNITTRECNRLIELLRVYKNMDGSNEDHKDAGAFILKLQAKKRAEMNKKKQNIELIIKGVLVTLPVVLYLVTLLLSFVWMLVTFIQYIVNDNVFSWASVWLFILLIIIPNIYCLVKEMNDIFSN